MKIPQTILRTMVLAAGLSMNAGCKEAPLINRAQPTAQNPSPQTAPQQTSQPNVANPKAPDPEHPRRISHDYCPPCGRG